MHTNTDKTKNLTMDNLISEPHSVLYDSILSPENIYSAIYALESYIYEDTLLSAEDIYMYRRLADKYDFSYIDSVIKSCQERLRMLLDEPEDFFDIQLYFKPQGYTADNRLAARPVHTACLLDQIAMVSLLNSLMFEVSRRKELQLSDIANLIPAHFYAHLPSTQADRLFEPEQLQFRKYADALLEKNARYKQTQEYTYGVSLDLGDFLPSVDPLYIYHYILSYLDDGQGDNQDLFYLKRVLLKLLFFRIDADKSDLAWKERYYRTASAKDIDKKLEISQGLPEGLPHVHFFANLCLIEVSRLFEKSFPGDSCYYGAAAALYTNVAELPQNFKDIVGLINLELDELFDGARVEEQVLPEELRKQYKCLQFKLAVDVEQKAAFSYLSEAEHLPILAQLPRWAELYAASVSESSETDTENKLKRVDAILQTLGHSSTKPVAEYTYQAREVERLEHQPEEYSQEAEPMVLGEPTEALEEDYEEDFDAKLDQELFGGMDEGINAIINEEEV